MGESQPGGVIQGVILSVPLLGLELILIEGIMLGWKMKSERKPKVPSVASILGIRLTNGTR